MTVLLSRRGKGCLQGALLVLVFITAALGFTNFSVSDDFADRRITAGAKIFRALLAADVDIAKKTGKDGSLKLCLLYLNDTRNAQRATEVLLNRADTRIRKIGARIETMPFLTFVDKDAIPVSGIFLTQPLSDDKLKRLLERSYEQHIVIFSPFEGDVGRGVHSGIAVESRVRPYLNLKALNKSEIRLKSFFLRVAKHYEE